MGKILRRLEDFISDESGAVTVDWVVLTAGVVALGLVVRAFIAPAIAELSMDTEEVLEQRRSCLSVASEGWSC